MTIIGFASLCLSLLSLTLSVSTIRRNRRTIQILRVWRDAIEELENKYREELRAQKKP